MTTIRLSRTPSASPLGGGRARPASTSALRRGPRRSTTAAALSCACSWAALARLRRRLDSSSAATTLGDAGLAARLRCRLTTWSAAAAVALLGPTTLGRRLLPLGGSATTFGSRRLLRLNPLAAGLLPLLAPHDARSAPVAAGRFRHDLRFSALAAAEPLGGRAAAAARPHDARSAPAAAARLRRGLRFSALAAAAPLGGRAAAAARAARPHDARSAPVVAVQLRRVPGSAPAPACCVPPVVASAVAGLAPHGKRSDVVPNFGGASSRCTYPKTGRRCFATVTLFRDPRLGEGSFGRVPSWGSALSRLPRIFVNVF